MRIHWLSGIFGDSIARAPAQPRRIRVTHDPVKPALRVTHQQTVKVKPTPVPVWQEQGWRRSSMGTYDGRYQTPYGSFDGRIETGFSRVSRVLIKQPPQVIQDKLRA